MLLAIDVGNTNSVFAVYDGEQLCGQWRMRTDGSRTADEMAVFLLTSLDRQGISAGHIDGAIMASVVPDVNWAIKQMVRRHFSCDLMRVGHGEVIVPMEVQIDEPEELGADRLMNAYGAWLRHKKPMVIVDFGTATTFDVVSADGAYMGGVIAPGINLSFNALQAAAAKLPSVSVQAPANVIGTNTKDAMQSGIVHGYVGLIEGIVAGISSEMADTPTVIATGGLATLYAEKTHIIEHVESDLVLHGLQTLYQRVA